MVQLNSCLNFLLLGYQIKYLRHEVFQTKIWV